MATVPSRSRLGLKSKSMKQLQNSQPFAVSTTFRPLNTAMKIVILGGMSSLQFYRQTTQEWLPDHSIAPVIDAHGQQTDGALRLQAEYTIYDVDKNLDVESIVPQIYWYINDTQVTTTDATADYYLVGDLLYVRKNFTHQNGVKVYCECRFVDTRTSSPQIMSDTLSLSAVLQADEQWSINILCDRTRKHFPLSAATTIYTFEAEARLGGVDKTAQVAWFWDYSLNNGSTWLTIGDDCLWYVNGKNSATLAVDMDFIEDLLVRCRIGVTNGTSTAAPDIHNEATASIAWRFPKILPTVFSYGGNRVFPETAWMTFGMMVHVAKHNDMTPEQKRHWLMPNWGIRQQGSTDNPEMLGEYGLEVTVPGYRLFNTLGVKYLVDPYVSLRTVYDVLADEDGELIQLSDGNTIAIRT